MPAKSSRRAVCIADKLFMGPGPVTHRHTPAPVVSEQTPGGTPHNQPASRWRATRRLAALGCGVMLLIAGVWICLQVGSGRARDSVTLAVPGPSGQPAASEEDRDERLRRLAVGTWRDFYQGKRTLTLRPDGTATMVVELSGLKARLFTPRLELDIAWSVEDGKMHRRTLGGRPAERIEFVNRRAGVAVAEPILELTRGRMILLDRDGSRKYTWRRVE